MVDSILFNNGRMCDLTSINLLLYQKRFHPSVEIHELQMGEIASILDYGTERFVEIKEYGQMGKVKFKTLLSQPKPYGGSIMIANAIQLCVDAIIKGLNYDIDYELEQRYGFFEQIIIVQRTLGVFIYDSAIKREKEIMAVFDGGILII